jgi:RNA polymerase sigma-70 factor (ECF subfamily)
MNDRVAELMDEEPVSQSSPERPSDDAAFYRYVVPEIPALLRVARSLTHNSHDAEDLVQDTILRAYRGIGNFDGAHPRAWLFTILRNTHINRNRRQRPDQFDDPNDVQSVPAGEGSDPTQRVEDAAFRNAVVAAISTLPEKMQLIVELVDLESCTYAEVAMALDIPMGTVMSRLHRGRRHIKEQLIAGGFVVKKVSST